jgi:hypothetical protein
MTALESFGEGISAVLSADIPGTSVNVAFGLGVGAAILGIAYLARAAFRGALGNRT